MQHDQLPRFPLGKYSQLYNWYLSISSIKGNGSNYAQEGGSSYVTLETTPKTIPTTILHRKAYPKTIRHCHRSDDKTQED